MKLVSLALVLMKIVMAWLKYLEQRHSFKEGELNALDRIQGELNEMSNRAMAARDAVDHSADSVSNDPNNRD